MAVLLASGPTFAETVPQPQNIDVTAAAGLLIELQDWPHARQMLEPAAAADPSNPELWFLLGLAHRGSGDEQAAAEAFRQAIKLRPSQPRPWLELGKSLTELKDFDAAKAAFDQGLRLADNRVVRRNIRKYLKVIEENRALNFWISTRVQPDTNPAISSGQRVVTIGGVPFVLNQPTSNKSAVGAGIVAGVRYAPWLTDSTRMVVELGYSGIHFLHACCADDNFTLATGPEFHLGNFSVKTEPYYRYRLYDDRAYSAEEGLHFDTVYTRPTWQSGAGAEAGASRLLGWQVAGVAARGFLSTDIAVTETLSIGTTLRFERDDYPIPSEAFSAPSIELRSTLPGPWDLPISLWGVALYRNYDGATLTSSGVRIDRYWGIGVSVELDFLNVWGMSPSVGLAYETEASNDPLGRFNRVRALLSIGKVF